MDGDDVMARRWSDLSDRSRRLVIAAATAEAILKTAVLIDIRRRPASQIRGSKRMWIVAAVLVTPPGSGRCHTSPSGGDSVPKASSWQLRARAA
jgi:hypothetical protein